MRRTEFLATACDPKTLTVGQLMQDAVFTCGSRTDALTISRQMIQRNFGSLPVVEEDRTLIGLISEYDLLQAIIDGRDVHHYALVTPEDIGYRGSADGRGLSRFRASRLAQEASRSLRGPLPQ